MFLSGYSRQILGSASVWLTRALWDVFNIASIERSVLKWLGWKGKSGWSPGVTLQDMESYPVELFSKLTTSLIEFFYNRMIGAKLCTLVICWLICFSLFVLGGNLSTQTQREESECPEPTEIDLELPFTELEWYAEFKFNTNYSQQFITDDLRESDMVKALIVKSLKLK